MTQPGNALRARLSHLTTADAAFEGRKGQVLHRMQLLNWDTATVSLLAQLAVQLARLLGEHDCLHRYHRSFGLAGRKRFSGLEPAG